MMQARWWKKNGDIISCNLCFRGCNIKQGSSGKCGVRFNKDGVLISPCLGKFCACAIDPVEKKPLFHWNSGKFIYSLGSVGCTMDCPFCQNHSIAFPARALYEQTVGMPEFAVDEIIRNVKESGLDLLAFTYNEPTLQAEYICVAAPALHDAGMSVALVTNGAMSHEVAKDLILCLDENDAANIDIKAFNPKTYKTLGGELDTVKKNIELFINAGIHVELTNLVVEEFIAMVDWIASISDRIPLHITRYFPARNYNKPPTDIELLYSLASMAKAKLKHVHIGNV